jgi:putative thiamine transport system ATP-binding protein
VTVPEGLTLNQVSLSIGGNSLFAPLSLYVPPGQVTTIMGASGSGKSTLLSAICGTLDPAFTLKGAIGLKGRDITGLPPHTRRAGILFQDDLLFPHLSVADNLAFGLPVGLDRRERQDRIRAALVDAGLEDFGARNPATLSGGQRARIACLRALLADPDALLLDEPFSKLDSQLRDRFRQFVFGHASAQKLPVLLVTHDPEDAEKAKGTTIHLTL